ncbi:NADP-dependent phosphogluconate dehydrogenase [Pedobacter flavus]|uniref:6-phosphogluconate dehydrogenase, decarboxylating n=1 Tax=Pedobacter flavus TaxID=3113906 RepID=A0ABU7H331_9SPHI|nr:NADP-dependent phosphogluconate dehydrogenase [Pedobacter sp. VNH31]MEE1885716.1 NADP-dependent phosphogluconate dehydrogenase [Pedobacter sp. VNH31]
MHTEKSTGYSLGMVGLGTMGRNLLLNLANNGFKVTGYDKNAEMIALLKEEGKAHKLEAYSDIEKFIASIETPRTIILLVPAGAIVDSVIQELTPLLAEGDIIIDSGNSHFTDTARRSSELEKVNINFFGMGISGGEEGARKGPSMMPGGNKDAYSVVEKMFDAIAAKVDGVPCVTYIGPGASGHYVKMVHNGIEYAIMQLLAEVYQLLKEGLNLSNEEIYATLDTWNKGRLGSFLLEITRDIFLFKDVKTGNYLVDMIKDEARSKGTGKWTSQEAMDLEVPIPTIDAAVSTRNLSKLKSLRLKLESQLKKAESPTPTLINTDDIENAFFYAMVSAYAQGMHMLHQASTTYNYDLNLSSIAKIWRGGCIIRSKFLNEMYEAFEKQADLTHLFEDTNIHEAVEASKIATHKVADFATTSNIAIPCLSASINYYNILHTGRMSSNLTQAQRDFFGAHTFERIDEDGIFHADWNGISPQA